MRNGWVDTLNSSPYTYEALRWQRYEHEPPVVSGSVLALALAGMLLLAFVVADVGVALSPPVKVTVTEVTWFSGNFSLGNGSGFMVAGGHTFSVGLVCEIFCPKFDGLTVSSPFTLVNDTIAYPWNEYVNVTAVAPATTYTGPLSIVLSPAPV